MRQFYAMFLLSWLALATANAGDSPPPRFSITIRIPNASTRLGEAIPLEIKMTNISHANIHYGIAFGERLYFDVRLVASNGKQVPESELGQKLNKQVTHGSILGVTLPVGESDTEVRMLDKEYTLDSPGMYTVQVERPDSQSGGIVVKSNAIDFKIVR